jgi:hypothetical protein
MKYVLAMYSDFGAWQRMAPDESRAFDEAIGTFNKALRDAGAWVSAEGFDEQARTVRFQDGAATVDEGPFGTTPERLGGYWVIEAADFDAAVEWGRKAPLPSGAVEVRPVFGE